MQHLLLINQNNPKKEFLEALLRGFLLRESFVILTIDRLSINFEFTIMSFHDLIGLRLIEGIQSFQWVLDPPVKPKDDKP
jgi:hypothetical protein